MLTVQGNPTLPNPETHHVIYTNCLNLYVLMPPTPRILTGRQCKKYVYSSALLASICKWMCDSIGGILGIPPCLNKVRQRHTSLRLCLFIPFRIHIFLATDMQTIIMPIRTRGPGDEDLWPRTSRRAKYHIKDSSLYFKGKRKDVHDTWFL